MDVARAVMELGKLGHFCSAANMTNDLKGYDRIELSTESVYAEYLDYIGLDELLERAYAPRDSKTTPPTKFFANWASTIGDNLKVTNVPLLLR